MDPKLMIINIVYLISFLCSLFIGVSLIRLRKSPLIGIFCAFYCLLCINVLSGIIFKNDLNAAPKAFCFFQGYMVQFLCYIISIALICFSHETYSLLVNYKRSTFFESKKTYYILIMIYPIVFGIPLFLVCLKFDAIQPRELKCDVVSPIWIRLIGYSGANFLNNIPGAYFSARSAYVLYKHLDHFKDNFSSNGGSNNSQSFGGYESSQQSQSTQSPMSRHFSQKISSQNNVNQKRYNMTKDVVIRMFVLSSFISLIYFLASITTIYAVVINQPISHEVNLNDWAGSIIGIATFIIFGFSREIRKVWGLP